jgi:hypothetical protein
VRHQRTRYVGQSGSLLLRTMDGNLRALRTACIRAVHLYPNRDPASRPSLEIVDALLCSTSSLVRGHLVSARALPGLK